jgi:hypothetical protein
LREWRELQFIRFGNAVPMTHDQGQKILQYGLRAEGILKDNVVAPGGTAIGCPRATTPFLP